MTTPYADAPPLTVFPGATLTPSRSPLYVDGIPVALASAPATAPGPQPPAGQRFWSSAPRGYGDQANEMMTVTLSSARLINYVSLDLPHFPAQYSLAYRGTDNRWHWIAGPNGVVLQFIISGSVPSLVNSAAALTSGVNPYPYGAGHWIHYDEPIAPVTAGAILVAGTRALQTVININPGQLPRDASGRTCPYPLGVRGLDFGYRVINRTDVPYTSRHPEIITERQVFAVAEDINGSPVQLTMRENRASDLLNGTPWKCAPQPFSSAVVNLYADARDPSGNPQVIDRFYIEPTTSGVSLNLYYTTSAPGSGFEAVDTPLTAASVQAEGSVPPAPDSEGLLFGNAIGWLTLGTQATGIAFTQPWWAAWEIEPLFGSADGGSYMICDTGIVQLWYQAGTWKISAANGTAVLASWPAAHSANDRLQFAAGWDGALLYAWSAQGTSCRMTPASSLPVTSQFWFGAPQPAAQAALGLVSIWPGNFRLTSFILKQEAPAPDPVAGGIPAQFTAFAAGPQAYTAPATGPGPTTVNACCRFDLSLVTGSLSPYGFAGGIGSAWTASAWIPIQQSWKMTTGYLQFTPVLAAGFRFEFTDLLAEPYEFYTATPQKARVFPTAPPDTRASAPPQAPPTRSASSAAASGANTPAGVTSYPPSADTGMVVNSSLAPQNFYADQPQARVPPAAGAALPTEALYGTDPYAADELQRRGGSMFNFQTWQSCPQGAPRQQVTGTEIYQEVSVTAASRIGYFAGLSGLTMLREDYTAASDTAEYIDTFGDTAGISPASLAAPVTGTTIPWTWTPGLLSVPASLPPGAVAQLTSPVLNGLHQYTGIQFASVQSAPVQLLPDPGFANPALPFVTNVGDALPLAVSEVTSSPLGSMIMVTRSPGQLTWNAMMASYPLWSAFTGPALTWTQLQGIPETSPYGGVAYTGAPVAVSAAGRVHIAGRVFAAQALTAPLYLQLLDGATNAVLAEQQVTVSGGSVTEWYASYTLGLPQAASTYNWNQVSAAYPLWSATAGQAWTGIDTYVPPLGNTLSWQLVQYGLTSDTWGVDNVSVFEDSIAWQFSHDGGAHWHPAWDISANPAGALVFPPPAPGMGTQLQWKLLGYRPNVTVSTIAIRPWYTCYPRGVPPRIPGLPHGPNVSHLDYYGPIEKDPYWQAWSGPVPQAWYFAYSQLLALGTTYTQPAPSPLPASAVVLGNGLVVPFAASPAGPVTYTDIYSDAYTDSYGVPDGSDVYTDSGGNGNYLSIHGPTP
jgi:hypothetical protein